MENESQSVFIEYFGSSPYIRALDFLIQGQAFDYSMTEIARGAGVGWGAFTKIWAYLLAKEMIIQTRTIGNAKLFTLNKKNPVVKKILQIDMDLTKAATHIAFEKEQAA